MCYLLRARATGQCGAMVRDTIKTLKRLKSNGACKQTLLYYSRITNAVGVDALVCVHKVPKGSGKVWDKVRDGSRKHRSQQPANHLSLV